MSDKTRQAMSSGKNPLKKRLEVLEAVLSEGIDRIIQDQRRIDENMGILVGAMEDIDNNVATLRAFGVTSGVFTDDAFEAKKLEVVALRDAAFRAAEAKEALAQAAKEVLPPDPSQPDTELVRMREKAVQAGKDTSLPDGAFVFGG